MELNGKPWVNKETVVDCTALGGNVAEIKNTSEAGQELKTTVPTGLWYLKLEENENLNRSWTLKAARPRCWQTVSEANLKGSCFHRAGAVVIKQTWRTCLPSDFSCHSSLFLMLVMKSQVLCNYNHEKTLFATLFSKGFNHRYNYVNYVCSVLERKLKILRFELPY